MSNNAQNLTTQESKIIKNIIKKIKINKDNVILPLDFFQLDEKTQKTTIELIKNSQK